jgi:hypothetical protein
MNDPDTSNKSGKHSTMQKPSSSRPRPNDLEDEPVTVDGATGNDDTRERDMNESPVGEWAPRDKANQR